MIQYYSRDQVNEILAKNKEQAKKEFDSIKYVENKKKQRLTPKELEQMLPQVKPKEQIFEEMKQNFKNSWKSPGYINDEFSHVPVLKANVLNTWQYDRINLAERSYKYPKGYRGFKVPVHGSDFGEASKDHLPEKFQKYLDDFSLKYQEFKMRPSKYGKLPIDERTETFQNRRKEPFKLTNSKQANYFGYDKHSTWETELKTITGPSRTILSTKYQTKSSQN
ncbi:hypothetical protein ABPG74_011471 [Tetrahymena malaccensis]